MVYKTCYKMRISTKRRDKFIDSSNNEESFLMTDSQVENYFNSNEPLPDPHVKKRRLLGYRKVEHSMESIFDETYYIKEAKSFYNK